MKKLIGAILSATMFISAISAGNDGFLIRKKMQTDLEIIKNSFQVKYAPFAWKKLYSNWNFENLVD